VFAIVILCTPISLFALTQSSAASERNSLQQRGGNPSLFGDEASVGLVGSDHGAASSEVGWDDKGGEDAGEDSKISRFDFVRYDAPPKEECR
jgi:hypothetical protein